MPFDLSTIPTALVTVFVVGDLVYGLKKDANRFELYKHLNPWLFLLAFPVYAAIALVAYSLDAINLPIITGLLHFGWWGLISGDNSASIISVPIQIPFLGILIGLLVIARLPAMAYWEEETFRKGTRNWASALRRSTVFGLMHMLMGISLEFALALIVTGLYLSALYFWGGIKLSTQAHLQYNLIIVVILLGYVTYTTMTMI